MLGYGGAARIFGIDENLAGPRNDIHQAPKTEQDLLQVLKNIRVIELDVIND